MDSETENKFKKGSSNGEVSRSLLRKYYMRLAELGIETVERGTRLQHVKWMCLKAEGHEDIEKLNRWLGWIQCTLDYEGISSLTETIAHTREEMKKYGRTE